MQSMSILFANKVVNSVDMDSHQHEKRVSDSSKPSKPSKRITGLVSTMNDSFQLTLHSLLHRAVAVQPNSEIVTALKNGKTDRMTFKQLKHESDKMSLALNAFGIKPGDIVGSFMWSNLRHYILYQSLPLMGAVLHTLNIRLHHIELSYLINHANDRIVFIDSDLLPLFEKIPIDSLKNVELFVICKEVGNNNIPKSHLPAKRCIYFEEFVEKYSNMNKNSNYKYPDLTENTGAVLCYTSGTTGHPKGVLYSHRSIYLSVLGMQNVDSVCISGSDCVLAIVPMFHVMGWVQPFVAMTFGNKHLLLGNVNNFTQILDMCLAEKCTVILGVPTVMKAFRYALSTNPTKYKPLRGVLKRAVCGGSAPSKSLITWFWDNWNIQLCQIWGMTECIAGSLGQPMQTRGDIDKSIKQQILDNSTTCGVPLPGFVYKIVDTEDMKQELPHNGKDMGELMVLGPTVTNRYFNVDDTEHFDNGFLRTGDIVTIDEYETMILKDRSKDVIKSGGEWISSVDMENYIMALPDIDKACVVAIKSEKYDERPIAIIQLFEDKQCSQQIIIDHLRNRYSNFQLPDDILYWKQIPLTGTGKMNKKEIRDELKKENYVLPKTPLRKILPPIKSKYDVMLLISGYIKQYNMSVDIKTIKLIAMYLKV